MYGTIARMRMRMRMRPGAEPFLRAQFDALIQEHLKGWVSTTFY